MTYRHYLISGRVQGVGYRNFVIRSAESVRLVGWVRNIQDGRVEVIAGGEDLQLGEFEKVLRKGPMLSDVTFVEANACANPDFVTERFIRLDDSLTPWKGKGK